MEGGVEDRHVGARLAGAAWRSGCRRGSPGCAAGEHRQGLDLADDLRGDHHRAGELAAAMDDPVADRGDVLGWKAKASPSRQVDSCITWNSSVRGKASRTSVRTWVPTITLMWAAAASEVSMMPWNVGAQVAGVVDAEVDLADAHVEGQHLARGVAVQRQGVGSSALAGWPPVWVLRMSVARWRMRSRQQPRQVGDRLRVGQDMGAETS